MACSQPSGRNNGYSPGTCEKVSGFITLDRDADKPSLRLTGLGRAQQRQVTICITANGQVDGVEQDLFFVTSLRLNGKRPLESCPPLPRGPRLLIAQREFHYTILLQPIDCTDVLQIDAELRMVLGQCDTPPVNKVNTAHILISVETVKIQTIEVVPKPEE